MTLKGLFKETYGTIIAPALPALAIIFKNKLIQIIPEIEFWFWIAVVSTGLLLISLAYILYNRPRYYIDEKSSCYIDKKGNKFCPACMANGRIALIEESEKYLTCCNFKECHFDKSKDGSSTSIFSVGVNLRPKL